MEEIEIWKPVVGYEGLYEVSSLGRVRSLDKSVNDSIGRVYVKKGKILRLCKDVEGYMILSLNKNNKQKTYKVHRLVGEAFIPNPNNLPMINHKDEDKTNNHIENLEWCDAKYNNNYGTTRQRQIQTKINNGLYVQDNVGLTYSDYHKKYREQHREKAKAYSRYYYSTNKESILEKMREKYKINKIY